MYEHCELIEGAKNCVVNLAGIKKGEKVVIWTDRSGKVDQQVIDILVITVEETGARAIVINEKPPIFRLGERVSETVRAVIEKADAVIHVFDLENAASIDSVDIQQIILEHPVRVIACICPTVELLSSEWARFPIGLFDTIKAMVTEKAREGPFRLTDANGTDLTGTLKTWPMGHGYLASPTRRKGFWSFFPPGEMVHHPESPVNGTVVFETLEGFKGLLKEPVRLTVKDHWVVEVEGGPEARWLKRMMSKYENSNYFCELAWGLNPKASISLGLEQMAPDTILYRHSGVFHCGLGLWPGVGVPCLFHWDGGGLRPSLYVGDELIIDRGRLTILYDPRLKAEAAKYGDPDDLLAEVL